MATVHAAFPVRSRSGPACSNQAMAATANEVETMQPSLVALLGDEQYQVGTYADFEGSFDKTYGAFKFLQRPAPGNHEFYDEHGEKGDDGVGYFDNFNGLQLDPQTGQPVTAADPFGNYVQPVPRASGQAGASGQPGRHRGPAAVVAAAVQARRGRGAERP